MGKRTAENSAPNGEGEEKHPEMGVDGRPEREPTFQDYMV
jgi:hypothetical protein